MMMMMMMMMMSNLSQGKSVPLPQATLQVQQDQVHRAALTGLDWKYFGDKNKMAWEYASMRT